MTPDCLVDEAPDARIARFTHWSLELSAQAITKALSKAGAGVDAVTGLVVNTCTGYICPGISTYLIERLGLSRSVRATTWWAAAAAPSPTFRSRSPCSKRTGEGVVVSVSVEIGTTTFQMDNDLSLILSNALATARQRRCFDEAGGISSWSVPPPLCAGAARYHTLRAQGRPVAQPAFAPAPEPGQESSGRGGGGCPGIVVPHGERRQALGPSTREERRSSTPCGTRSGSPKSACGRRGRSFPNTGTCPSAHGMVRPP